MMSFEKFNKYLTKVQNIVEFGNELHKLCHNLKDGWSNIEFPSAIDEVIELLEDSMGDDNHWISYWVWDLNFGQCYTPGMVMDKNGDPVPLQTVEDLWTLLCKEKETERKEEYE